MLPNLNDPDSILACGWSSRSVTASTWHTRFASATSLHRPSTKPAGALRPVQRRQDGRAARLRIGSHSTDVRRTSSS